MIMNCRGSWQYWHLSSSNRSNMCEILLGCSFVLFGLNIAGKSKTLLQIVYYYFLATFQICKRGIFSYRFSATFDIVREGDDSRPFRFGRSQIQSNTIMSSCLLRESSESSCNNLMVWTQYNHRQHCSSIPRSSSSWICHHDILHWMDCFLDLLSEEIRTASGWRPVQKWHTYLSQKRAWQIEKERVERDKKKILFTILVAMLRLNSRQCSLFMLQRRLRYLPSVTVDTYNRTSVRW